MSIAEEFKGTPGISDLENKIKVMGLSESELGKIRGHLAEVIKSSDARIAQSLR